MNTKKKLLFHNSECTSILVGKNMTTDNSFISARSSDSHVLQAEYFKIFPHIDSGPDTFRALDSNFVCKNLPAIKLRYTAINYYSLPEHWGSTGYNEVGVVMSATETIFNSEKVLAIDPYNEDIGLKENAVYEIVLPYIHTAKEGVLRLGALIEQYGVGEGFGIAFIDQDGLRYLETACGHLWMATRIPDDKYFVSANQGRLRDFNPDDENNYLASKNLITFAKEHLGYDSTKEKFDFHELFVGDVQRDIHYNYPRIWILQQLFSPKIQNDVTKNTFPVFATAEKKIAIEDIKNAFRNHYQGTEHDPYFHNNPKEPYRPIAIFRTAHTHISQIRPELPKDIGIINYVAVGMPALGVFLPYYFGMTKYIDEFMKANGKASNNSAYWIFRKPQTLAMVDYNKYALIVQKAYADFEIEIHERQKELELQYLALYKEKPQEAKVLIQEFSEKMMHDALQLSDNLTNELFTLLTENTENTYPFYGA